MAWDVLVKNGTLIDGSGREPVRADVAVQGERIAAVGDLDGTAAPAIDADGLVVTPGFIDIHSHLDAQVMWDPEMTSPCWHGVTTVVMGNCGLSLAPCRPEELRLPREAPGMGGGHPGRSILAGHRFDGGSFGDYLDLLERLPKGVNVGGWSATVRCASRRWASAAWTRPRPSPRTSSACASRRRGHGERRARLLDLPFAAAPDFRRPPCAGNLRGEEELLRHRSCPRPARPRHLRLGSARRAGRCGAACPRDRLDGGGLPRLRPALTFAVLQNRDNPRALSRAARDSRGRERGRGEARSPDRGALGRRRRRTRERDTLRPAWPGWPLKGLSLEQKLAALRATPRSASAWSRAISPRTRPTSR